MNYIYIDEHENEKDGRRYTSATASAYNDENIFAFRAEIIVRVRDSLFPNDNENTVTFLPVLHACNLPRDLEDDKKIELFSIVLDVAANHSVRFFRVGYFDESIQHFVDSRERRVEFVLSSMMWPIQSRLSTERDPKSIYFYELNHAVNRVMQSYND